MTPVKYTDEIKQFIIQNYFNYTYRDLVKMVNEKYKTNFSESSIREKTRILIKENNLSNKPAKCYREKEFSKEMEKFILTNYPKISCRKLTNIFNKQFNVNYSSTCLLRKIEKLEKEGKTFKRRIHKFTEEQNNWLKEKICYFYQKELADEFNKTYNTNLTWQFIARHCVYKLNIRMQSQKKHNYRNYRYMDIGEERVDSCGYVLVKNKQRKWVRKHRLVWESHFGKIPDGYKIVFLDENKSNLNIENLVCVSKDVQGALSMMKQTSPKIKKCKIASMQLNEILNKINESEVCI